MMADQFMPEKEVLKLKQEYPPGTRIVLNHMDDKWAVPPGTRGTVRFVDDSGQIHPIWDNGRTLAIVPETDSFRKMTEQDLKEEQQLGSQELGEQQWQIM
jgi:hypothetical protein